MCILTIRKLQEKLSDPFKYLILREFLDCDQDVEDPTYQLYSREKLQTYKQLWNFISVGFMDFYLEEPANQEGLPDWHCDNDKRVFITKNINDHQKWILYNLAVVIFGQLFNNDLFPLSQKRPEETTNVFRIMKTEKKYEPDLAYFKKLYERWEHQYRETN